jgi:mitotic spindle assembly checkpoint protein MAD2
MLTLTTGTFTILAYTNDAPDTAVPATWGDADPHLIDRGKVEQVRLRSFSTNVHSLEAMVTYRVGE